LSALYRQLHLTVDFSAVALLAPPLRRLLRLQQALDCSLEVLVQD
jgi:hypothetical protein